MGSPNWKRETKLYFRIVTNYPGGIGNESRRMNPTAPGCKRGIAFRRTDSQRVGLTVRVKRIVVEKSPSH